MHAAEVVDAVGVGDVGVPGLALGHLLGAAVVVADVGDDVDDLLVAQADDDAERPVGAAVLRADVEEHERRGRRSVRGRPHSSGLKRELLLPSRRRSCVGQREGARLGAAGRVLLAQRVALPPRRHEEAVQVRVAVDADAEHVPDLALVPVGGGPQAGDGRHRGASRRQRHLEAHVGVAVVGEEVVDDGEVGVGLALAVQPLALVDAAEVVEHAERLGGLVLEVARAPRRHGRPGTHTVGMPSAVACSTNGTSGKRSRSSRARPAAGPRLRRPHDRPLARLRRASRPLRPVLALLGGASSITSRPGAAACRSPRRRRGAGRAARCRAA